MLETSSSGPAPAAETSTAGKAQFVDAKGIATLFDPPLCVNFVRKLQSTRVIPFVRLGRRVLFSPTAVVEALNKRNTIHPRGKAVA